MRGVTLSILSHRVKGQIQLLHSVYKTLCTRYRLQSDRFRTSYVNCGWWEREPYWFWVTGSKVKVIFGTLHVKPCGQNTGYTFCPITCKLQMQVVGNERRNPVDFGSRGQSSTYCLWKGLSFVPTPSTKLFMHHFMNNFHEFSHRTRCKF